MCVLAHPPIVTGMMVFVRVALDAPPPPPRSPAAAAGGALSGGGRGAAVGMLIEFGEIASQRRGISLDAPQHGVAQHTLIGRVQKRFAGMSVGKVT